MHSDRHLSRQQLRERHLDYFQPGADGRSVYTGPYYRTQLTASGRRAFVVLAVVNVLFFVLMGVLPIDAPRVFYVMFPYALTLFSAALTAWCTYRILRSGGRMMEFDYIVCSERLFLCTVFQILLNCIAAVGMLVFLFLHAEYRGNPANWLFVLAGLLCAAWALIFYRRILPKYPWEKCTD